MCIYSCSALFIHQINKTGLFSEAYYDIKNIDINVFYASFKNKIKSVESNVFDFMKGISLLCSFVVVLFVWFYFGRTVRYGAQILRLVLETWFVCSMLQSEFVHSREPIQSRTYQSQNLCDCSDSSTE